MLLYRFGSSVFQGSLTLAALMAISGSAVAQEQEQASHAPIEPAQTTRVTQPEATAQAGEPEEPEETEQPGTDSEADADRPDRPLEEVESDEAVPVVDAGVEDLEQVPLEDLLMVTTASKRARALAKAPATITVITAEDIRRMGHVHLGEILSRVAGVSMLRQGTAERPVASRKVPDMSDFTTLILIDGRPSNLDFSGTIASQGLPVDLVDIKQIEVIRGPGSALYGNQAMHMVINITTYDPEDIDGARFRTRLSLKRGEASHFGSAVAGKRFTNGLELKMSATYWGLEEWQDFDARRDTLANSPADFDPLRDGFGNGPTDSGALQHIHGSGQVGYQFAPDNHLFFRLEGVNTLSDAGVEGSMPMEIYSSFLMGRLDWNYGDLEVLVWARSGNNSASTFLSEEGFRADWKVGAAEVNYSVSADSLGLYAVVGGEVRGRIVDSEIVREDPHQLDSSTEIGPLMQYSPYFQAEYTPLDDIDLSLVAGARFDRSDIGGNKLSVKSSILYTPVDEAAQAHTFYFSFGPLLSSALRQFDSEQDSITIATGYSNPTVSQVYGLVPVGVEVIGNQRLNFYLTGPGGANNNLNAPRVDYWEVGYRGRYEDIRLNVDLFLYEEENRIVSYAGDPVLIDLDDDGAAHLGLTPNFNDDEGMRGFGGEVELRYTPSHWMSVYANYAYLSMSLYELDFTATAEVENLLRDHNQGAPMHQVGGGAHFATDSGQELDLQAQWVDGYRMQITDANRDEQAFSFSPRTTVHVRVGQRFLDDSAELSLHFYNVLDRLQNDLQKDDEGALALKQPGADQPSASKPEAGVFVNLTLHM